jgi:Protein of unknown function (DUF1236)
MKRLLMISSAIGLCLAAPAFAQTAPNQDRMNAPRATSPNSSAPAASQSAPRQPQSANQPQQQQPASGGSSSAQAPASSDQSQSATGSQNQSGQAQSQQQPSSSTSAQAPASSNQSPSATSNQNQRGQAQNQRQPAASSNEATNAQTPANQRQRSSASDPNQPAQRGQAQNRQSQQNMQRQDQRQDARQDRREQRQDARDANADRASASVNVNINDTQRTRIASVIRSNNVRPVNVDFRIATGVVVPSRVTLHTLPPDIVSIVPQYRGHRYFVTNEQIVIVEPAKKTIVAVLPSSGASARAQAPAAKVSFTDQQRQIIRSRASSMRSTPTTGAAPAQLVVEQEVPATVELLEFPTEIVTEVPVVRTYRYFRQDNDVVVVDPTERRVIEVIR